MDAISSETCCVSLAHNQTAQKLEKDTWQIARALHVFHVRARIQHRGTSGHAAAEPPAKFHYPLFDIMSLCQYFQARRDAKEACKSSRNSAAQYIVKAISLVGLF